jgi:hypothetical protein
MVLVPFGEVEIARHDGGALLLALGDEGVQVFVKGHTKRLEAEVVDDQERDPCQRIWSALLGAGGPSRT